ncbi:hypothetical protein E2C01_065929 [Portunus trituberculatus]|uniref:Uncharacterized protein n=1 Tax=Portunus trituberculatus TaxID=210409 RepID=A0A5B7HPR5_PORTR|nr:hypothetical protein [Portunus trituberculatus]
MVQILAPTLLPPPQHTLQHPKHSAAPQTPLSLPDTDLSPITRCLLPQAALCSPYSLSATEGAQPQAHATPSLPQLGSACGLPSSLLSSNPPLLLLLLLLPCGTLRYTTVQGSSFPCSRRPVRSSSPSSVPEVETRSPL